MSLKVLRSTTIAQMIPRIPDTKPMEIPNIFQIFDSTTFANIKEGITRKLNLNFTKNNQT